MSYNKSFTDKWTSVGYYRDPFNCGIAVNIHLNGHCLFSIFMAWVA